MTIKNLLAKATRKLRAQKIDTARLDAEVLLVEAISSYKSLDINRSWLTAHDHDTVEEDLKQLFEGWIEQRSQYTPVAYIIGKKEFHGLELTVSPDVLTPRPETEELVDKVIDLSPKSARIIDVGTGSGAIACAIKSARQDLEVSGVDIEDEAINIAKSNAKKHNLDISIYKSDLLENANGRYNVIVANLPYLAPSIHAINIDATHEPVDALFDGSEDGLDSYRKLLEQSQDKLEAGGYMITEAEPSQHKSLIASARKQRLKKIDSYGFCLVLQKLT